MKHLLTRHIFKPINGIALILSLLTAIITSARWTFLVTHRYFDGEPLFLQGLIVLALAIVYFPVFYFLCYLIKRAVNNLFPAARIGDLLPQVQDPQVHRVIIVVSTLIVAFLSIYFLVNLIGQVDIFNAKYTPALSSLGSDLIGIDFRNGIYNPAREFTQYVNTYPLHNNDFSPRYPPLTTAIGLPFLLFNENTASLILMAFLYFFMIASVGLCCLIINRVIFSKLTLNPVFIGLVNVSLFVIVSFFAVSSYPFQFEAERGNFNIATVFFALLGLWVTISQPKRVWLQVLFFSIAFHLKVYPGLFLIIPLIRHGKKSILPILMINLVFLFILGPQNAFGFIKDILASLNSPNIIRGVVSASGKSFAAGLVVLHSNLVSLEPVLASLFTYLPLILWILSVVLLIPVMKKESGLLFLFAVSIPPMAIVPMMSYDYKLVILIPSLIVCLGYYLFLYVKKGFSSSLIGMLTTLIFCWLITKPFDATYQIPYILNNKYPAVLAFQIFILLVVSLNVKTLAQETSPLTSQFGDNQS